MHIINSIVLQLQQLSIVIRQLSQEEYNMSSIVLSQATIGQHTRHIIEHFLQLVNSYDAGRVNYEIRPRDKEIETDKLVALSVIRNIESQLYKPDKKLMVVTEDHIYISSSYHRELLFNLSHLVHHMALIRIGVSATKSVEFPEGFGFSSSTINYRTRTRGYE
jgi:hypothetical protein